MKLLQAYQVAGPLQAQLRGQLYQLAIPVERLYESEYVGRLIKKAFGNTE
ncbi:MAG: hypothetical protein JWP57_940 [Spirosoma sp.]|nr:hypothetical protein [Spirosoma sp.]